MKSLITSLAVASMLVAGAGNIHAEEKPFVLEGLVGSAVPTFDITDLADPGFVAGGAIGYVLNENFLVMAETDFGTHPSAAGGPDIKVFHYIGKVGYKVFASEDGKWRIYANLGAGMLTFKADVDNADSNSYAAINAGAKIYYDVSDMLSIVVSPQGDIGFVDEADGFTGSTAWVWPFTAGLAVNF